MKTINKSGNKTNTLSNKEKCTLYVFTTIIFLSFNILVSAQTILNGIVLDENKTSVCGANVFIKGSYDGASTDSAGNYAFTTTLSGQQVLMVSFLGYEATEVQVNLNSKTVKQNVQLLPSFTKLDDIEISGGTFEASDRKKGVTLKALDVVTTPSANGDIYGAISTLPGTTTIGNDGRLFVRGGDAYECKTYIDGMLVNKPYTSNVPDIPSRARFSAKMFSGTMFSSGGYSAEYGQALSSALILQTDGTTEDTHTGLSIFSLGAGVSHSQKWDKGSIQADMSYFNMEPYYRITKFDQNWKKYPKTLSGTLFLNQQTRNNGTVKVFATLSASGYSMDYPTYVKPGSYYNVGITNRNFYINSTLTQPLNDNAILKAGIALAADKSNLTPGNQNIEDKNKTIQGRISIKNSINPRFSINTGIEWLADQYAQNFSNGQGFTFNPRINNNLWASFTETEWMVSRKLALRAGLRAEHASVIEKSSLAPRLSAAWLLNKGSQISIDYGWFYQTPQNEQMRFTRNLAFEKAEHLIAKYQITRNDRIFRIETYRKQYKNLVTYQSLYNPTPAGYGNNGSGFSQGIDLFFRDEKSVRFLDYSISYSWVDSHRKWKNYPVEATPEFVAEHNFNIVGKYFVRSINTQFAASFSAASGRTYYNPNNANFMTDKTPGYSNLSINCSYLTELWNCFTIIHLSMSNVLGHDHVFGYHYYSTPNSMGAFDREAINFSQKRFFMAAIFVTI